MIEIHMLHICTGHVQRRIITNMVMGNNIIICYIFG